ncbi:MAG: adenylate/guanylate cyclase domain-containing protein, partial [bacterium]|nr:adenylate/guanylate cyclase domain-containing protein [bacterium]
MFKHLIPSSVYKNFIAGQNFSWQEGIVMFIDIVGFTAMTENLIMHGKEGSEILSEIINKVFSPSIEAICTNDGNISSFSGDAFTSTFLNNNEINAVNAALNILDIFNKLKIKTKFGSYKLVPRITLASGDILTGIIRTDLQNTFYFSGSAIEKATEAEKFCKPGIILTDEVIYKHLKDRVKFSGKVKSFHQVASTNRFYSSGRMKRLNNVSRTVLEQFFPKELLSQKSFGEFREVVSVFIALSGLTRSKDPEAFHAELEKKTKVVISEVNKFKGFFNKITFDDKGWMLLILFGAPVGIEDPCHKALDFILELKKNLGNSVNVKFGASFGTVYAGLVGSNIRGEYSVLGKTVNLSSRLTVLSKQGQISCDEQLFNESVNSFEFKKLPATVIKGFKNKQNLFGLTGKKKEVSESFTGMMIGREKELIEIEKFIINILNKKFGGICYIHGHAGIGKSRLVYEIVKRNSEKINFINCSCNDISKEGFNPIITLLKDLFKQKENDTREHNLQKFKNTFSDFLKNTKNEKLKSELSGEEPFIASLLGFDIMGKNLLKLAPKAKYENTVFALKNIFKSIAIKKPSVLIIEDGHFLDEDTITFIKNMARNTENLPFAILITTRFLDGAKKLNIPVKNIPEKHLTIDTLSRKQSTDLISSILKRKSIHSELVKLIEQKTAGNPFYIEQILLYLKENSILSIEEKWVKLTNKEFSVPSKINAVIISRIDRLNAELKKLVKTASVLGNEFSVEILSKMLGGISLNRELKEVESEAIWSPLSELFYIFKHAIIRDTVYEMQLKKSLRALHKLAGQAIETMFGKDNPLYFGKLAYHFEKAEVKEKSKKYLNEAARFARESYRNLEALDYLNRLIKYLNSYSEKTEHMLTVAWINVLVGEWTSAEKTYKELLKGKSKLRNKLLQARIMSDYSALLRHKGQFKEGIEVAKKANKLFLQTKNYSYISENMTGMGNLYLSMSQYSEAEKIFKDQLILAKKYRMENQIGSAHANLGNLYFYLSKFNLVTKYWDKAISIFKKLGDTQKLGSITVNYGTFNLITGNHSMAMNQFKEFLKISRDIGDRLG